MKTILRTLPGLVGAALVAGFAVAASAQDYAAPAGATPVHPGSSCYYLNYDANAAVGQGSGGSLTAGRLVCP